MLGKKNLVETSVAPPHSVNAPEQPKKKEIPIVCQRIRYFREKKGIEQKELARELGIGSNAISNWETGRARPTIQLLPKISEILEISISELFGMSVCGTPKQEPKSAITTYPEKKSYEDPLLEKYNRLSRGHQSVVDALLDMLCMEEDEALYKSIRITKQANDQFCANYTPDTELEELGTPLHVYASKAHPELDFVFPVSDDSMEPKFHNGDLVMVQHLHGGMKLRNGEIGAFICGTDAYIKVYTKAGLRALNKKYKMIRFADNEHILLVGRVLGVLNPAAIVDCDEVKRYEKVKKRMEERDGKEIDN